MRCNCFQIEIFLYIFQCCIYPSPFQIMNSLSLKEDINIFLTKGSFSYSCKLHTKLREWFDAPDAEDQPYAKNKQVHKI